MTTSANKVRWGDTLDEDDSLPSNTISGPDKQGIQTITEYKRNDKGETVKVTTKVRIAKVERKIYAVSVDVLAIWVTQCLSHPEAGIVPWLGM